MSCSSSSRTNGGGEEEEAEAKDPEKGLKAGGNSGRPSSAAAAEGTQSPRQRGRQHKFAQTTAAGGGGGGTATGESASGDGGGGGGAVKQRPTTRFKIKRTSIDLGQQPHRRGGAPTVAGAGVGRHQQQKVQATIDEGQPLETAVSGRGRDDNNSNKNNVYYSSSYSSAAEEESEMRGAAGRRARSPTVSRMKVFDTRRFSRGGSSLEFPPNIDFYRNTLDKEDELGGAAPSRPSIMDLVEGAKQRGRRESLFNLEIFRQKNQDILEGQRRALGKVRNQPKRSDSDSSKKSLQVQQRPALSARRSTASVPSPAGGGGADKGTPNKFGWIEGVLIRCMASIFGVMLYLRLSWVAGQSGILLGSCVVLLGTLITVITALSTSAICTNGLVKGGGAYFLISRSLGPEFGGSIGIIFSIANAVGAAMYLVGFAETIRDLLRGYGIALLDGDINDIRAIALVACAMIVLVILVGLSFESKMQVVLMVVLWLSIFDYWIGTFLPPDEEQQRKGITGFRMETLKENLMPQYRNDYNFFTVFAVYFPAATGIMAGANISGDLGDPETAIPLGTLVAIAITSVVYLVMVWMTGATTVRDSDGLNAPQLLLQGINATSEMLLQQFASQTVQLVSAAPNDSSGLLLAGNGTATVGPPVVQEREQLSSNSLFYAPLACALNQSCPYGLMNYYQVVELGSAFGPLVTVGIIASTLSSALVSMVGAPKIFQAVCQDRLFPYIHRFGRGHGPNNDPRQALFLASGIVVAVILIGNLNLIAPLISNFFLCSYALINYACFDNSFAHSPGFRPSFRFYNKWVSLLGSLMCVFCMFIISWWTALFTFFLFVTIYVYVAHRKPDVNWGSSAQAHSYRNALQYVSKLERTEEHVKNYRPQLLVLSGNPAARAGLVDFAYSITKGSSLLICGYIVPYKACNTVFVMMQRLGQQLRDWFVGRHMKGTFCCAVANPNLRAGTQTLLQISGLGKLRPNILLMGFKHNWASNCQQRLDKAGIAAINDYFGLIRDAFDLNMSVGVLRNSNRGLDISELILETTEEWRLHQQQQQHMASMTSGTLPTAATSTIKRRSSSPPPSAGPMSVVNSRQRARDMLLKAFGQRTAAGGGGTAADVSVGRAAGLTVGSAGTMGGDTLQTTLGGQSGTGSTMMTLGRQQQQRRGLIGGWLGRPKQGGATTAVGMGEPEETGDKINEEDLQQQMSLPLPSDALRFQTRVKHGTIDVWWLYDDGGLTLLIPYLLTKEKSYLEGAKLRVFTLAGQGKNLQQEQQGLVTMLRKFRITADQVNVIPDFTSKRPDQRSLAKFEQLIEPFVHRSTPAEPMGEGRKLSACTVTTIPLEDDHDDTAAAEEEGGEQQHEHEQQPPEGMVTEAELNAQRERTWRQLRIAELLRRYSSDSDLIVVTLPVPRRGLVNAALYLAWLEMISQDLPPTLMLRGNQQSVLTFYS